MFLEYISKSVSKTTGLQKVGKFPSFLILTILHSILQHTSWQAFLPLLILSVCLSHQTGSSALPVLKRFLKRRQILCIPTDFPAKYHHKVRRQMQREGSAVNRGCSCPPCWSALPHKAQAKCVLSVRATSALEADCDCTFEDAASCPPGDPVAAHSRQVP